MSRTFLLVVAAVAAAALLARAARRARRGTPRAPAPAALQRWEGEGGATEGLADSASS